MTMAPVNWPSLFKKPAAAHEQAKELNGKMSGRFATLEGSLKAWLSGTKAAKRPEGVEPRALRFCSSTAWW